MKPNARRYESDQVDGLHGEQEELFMQTINHLRHDWMNDIQVLYGYLKLKKYDKMHDYMEILKDKMFRESGISKLGIPSLIVYLQSFRVRCRSIRLDVELDPELHLAALPVDAQTVTDTITAVIEAIVSHADMPADGEPGKLLLRLCVREQVLAIGFEYNGSYDGSGLERELGGLLSPSREGQRFEGEATYDEDGAVIDIYMPLGG
ncbi:hypothetical protein FE784_04585 [Paenibacillus hemerocallicola]|uniref:SpoOB alpha-helical domain-containing protein n=1 Tax=Paenibacillus hemerocallicola TaxID=1172614 RepID=A0A5C4TEY4_9BACL|nr:Spo0B domain-containing protein [Paenibacillus hemerocallicola]TNJ67663.1 hypothetical protein FE784_04585 [Paenibacillus hemerocallicola]